MIRRSALAVVFSVAASGAAVAADWVERPFNPPVGSVWSIESKAATDDRRDGSSRTMNVTTLGDLTIDARNADGFKITFVNRTSTVEGNAQNVPLLRDMTAIMNGLVIRAQMNDAGRPVKLDNLEEVRGKMRQVIDTMKARFKEKPAVADMIEKMMSSMLLVDEARAAELYIDNAVLLVMGQKTGLKVGELRRSVEENPSPLGGGTIKSNIAMQILKADQATGKVSYLRTSAYDVPSVKELIIKLTRQILAAAGDKPGAAEEMEKVLKQMDISMDGRTEIEVEDGMTRRVNDRSEMRASAMGRNAHKVETKIVTVTRVQ